MLLYMSLPPNEDPTNFPSGLIFNPLFFENQGEPITTEQIKKIAITYPVPQDTLIQFPNTIGAPNIRSNGMLSEDGSTAIYSYNQITDKLTLERDTIVGNLQTALSLKTNLIKSNDGTKNLISFDGADINITQNMTAFNIVGQSLKLNTIKGADDITYISYDPSNENTTINKAVTTTLKTDEIIRNDPTGNVKIFNGSGFGVNLQTATSETFTANQLKIGQTGSSVLVQADSVDITGTANITTLSNLPTITASLNYTLGGTDYSVLNKLGGTYDTGFLFGISYIAGTNMMVYVFNDPFPSGVYLASAYFTIPPNSTWRLRCLSTEIAQIVGDPITGLVSDNAPLIRRYNGNATENETGMTGQIVISSFNYLSFFSQFVGSGTHSRTLRLILTRIG